MLLPAADDVDALARRLTAAGHAFDRGGTGFTVDDPWGNTLAVGRAPAGTASDSA